jgi:hypothetical protein
MKSPEKALRGGGDPINRHQHSINDPVPGEVVSGVGLGVKTHFFEPGQIGESVKERGGNGIGGGILCGEAKLAVAGDFGDGGTIQAENRGFAGHSFEENKTPRLSRRGHGEEGSLLEESLKLVEREKSVRGHMLGITREFFERGVADEPQLEGRIFLPSTQETLKEKRSAFICKAFFGDEEDRAVGVVLWAEVGLDGATTGADDGRFVRGNAVVGVEGFACMFADSEDVVHLTISGANVGVGGLKIAIGHIEVAPVVPSAVDEEILFHVFRRVWQWKVTVAGEVKKMMKPRTGHGIEHVGRMSPALGPGVKKSANEAGTSVAEGGNTRTEFHGQAGVRKPPKCLPETPFGSEEIAYIFRGAGPDRGIARISDAANADRRQFGGHRFSGRH